MGGGKAGGLVDSQLEVWASELIDLTWRNRLLFFRHTASTSLEFAQDAALVEQGLGRGWHFHLPPAPPEDPSELYEPGDPQPDQLVVAMSPERYGPQIERGIKNLARSAQSEFLDSGLWVLYLGLGMLRWTDVDGREAASPLLLLPVQLAQYGSAREWLVSASDDGEPALNPALAVKLERDFGIRLPVLDDLANPDVAGVVDAVAGAVDDSPWRIERRAVLTRFTFHKEVIYRDLHDNAAAIAAHPTVRLLVEGPSSDVSAQLDFVPIAEDDLDTVHPPEELVCVLDADSTQRQCLIAARQGRSFVMDGPPGTGKSQTITNVIAQLLADGKTVLFVSEKAAALDVVRNRLSERSLDPFVLALHTHTATRKAVAQEFGRVLDERLSARDAFDSSALAKLRQDRERLSAYAVAVNVVRQPLGRSLHDVIGRISRLADLPDTPVPATDTQELDAAEFATVCDLGDQLGRAWGPVARGDDFVWRELEDRRSGAGRESNLRQRVVHCGEALTALETQTFNVADELRLLEPASSKQAADLLALLRLVDERSAVAPQWLAADTAAAVRIAADIETLTSELRSREQLVAALDLTAPTWRRLLPPETGKHLERLDIDFASLQPSVVVADGLDASSIRTMATAVEAALGAVDQLAAPLGRLAAAFGVRRPVDIGLAERLVELGRLVGSPSPPEPDWLNPGIRQMLDEARLLLSELLTSYRARRAALATVFTEAAVQLDLQALHVRFSQVHRGLGRLSGAYRSDKRALAAVTVTGKANKHVLARLEEAVEWQRLGQSLEQAERQHAGKLGSHYWSSRDEADVDRIERAFGVAESALSLAAGDVPIDDLRRQLAYGAEPDPDLPGIVHDVADALAVLRAIPLAEVLSVEHAELDQLSLPHLGEWLRPLAKALRSLGDFLDDISGAAGKITVGAARQLTAQRAAHARAETAIEDLAQGLAPHLGDLLDGLDPDEIESASAWVAGLRAHFGDHVPPRTCEPLLSTTLRAENLRPFVDRWMESTNGLLGVFQAEYAIALREDLDTSFSNARELLDHLERSVGDIAEWEQFSTVRDALGRAGWGPAVEACIEQKVEATQVGDLVERAVLQRWADQVIDLDSDLLPKRSVDRDQLREEFGRLDTELVEVTAARVINACAARRPQSLAGQAGIIKQQAQLKRRHKPVRQLLGEAGEAALRLKPCFMMSPLSVSQFLPPGLRFDVVIFDEASQVREADAICCIYRGDQLIVAGDDKQLPPTNFFQRTTDAEDEDVDSDLFDFESVLGRCKAQGLPALPLSWHYRSRHESLITFSNRSFYEGRLQTFPGAVFEADDLGVELFRVDGRYDRGGLRENKIEAAMVVERVLHHRRHHPDLTIGVVALSGAQQSVIDATLEDRSRYEPELAALVSNDRLSGFFVKNLENVQGDERDLIILSIGYGPDEAGKFTMNFGPMSKPGGERRLNVAVTRARRRVEVICSFHPGEIRTDNATTRHLARYLAYAERGIEALALDLDAAELDAESPFEEDVLRVVRSLGYECVPQVGVAGYRIDVGVRHPSRPGSYVLGIECDGATYHSSKVARDRDRLRREVLEGLGWKIHPIWSTAWNANRDGEIERLRLAIDRSIRGEATKANPTPSVAPGFDVEVEEQDFYQYPGWTWAYEDPEVTNHSRHTDLADPAARPDVVRQIREVVEGYGPIHRDQVLETLRRAWGAGRSGARIRTMFDGAVSTLVTRAELRRDGDFLSVPRKEAWVRVPADESTPSRPVKFVSPAERDLAIVQLLRDAGTTPAGSLQTTWARLFGWRRVGHEIEIAFDDAVERLVGHGLVERRDDDNLRAVETT